MPTRYWNASTAPRKVTRVVRRPPNSAGLVLQQNMVRIWTGPFTFANILVLGSFGLLARKAMGVPVRWQRLSWPASWRGGRAESLRRSGLTL
jgi:hypothetical protein